MLIHSLTASGTHVSFACLLIIKHLCADVPRGPGHLLLSFNAPLAHHQQAAAIRMMCACARHFALAI